MASDHSMTCCIEMLGVEIELEVEYSYRAGTADSYYEPGDPAEIELLSAVTRDGRDILQYLSDSRPDPKIEIVEQRNARFVHARQGFTDTTLVAEHYVKWVVKISGDTYADQIYEFVSENHEDDDGYDDDWG